MTEEPKGCVVCKTMLEPEREHVNVLGGGLYDNRMTGKLVCPKCRLVYSGIKPQTFDPREGT